MRARPLALLLAIALSLGACTRRPGADDDPVPIDVQTMAYLSEARAFHHQASLKEETNDLPGAIASLERLTRAARPHPDRAVPEVEEVLADAYARLAELELQAGDLAGAERAVKEGLGHATEPTFFRGHLVEVQGLVEKARSASLADAGRPDEARAARERAIQLLDEAVKIQDKVVQGSLRDGGARR